MSKRHMNKILFAVSCLMIVWITLLSRNPKTERSIDLRLFWAFKDLIAGKKYGFVNTLQNICNILLFIPFGYFVPKRSWIAALIAGLVFSTLIESTQYFFALGRCELDDVISNTIGSMVGYWISISVARYKDMRSKDEA
jgi:glycopeptide antibiotics resistance protein